MYNISILILFDEKVQSSDEAKLVLFQYVCYEAHECNGSHRLHYHTVILLNERSYSTTTSCLTESVSQSSVISYSIIVILLHDIIKEGWIKVQKSILLPHTSIPRISLSMKDDVIILFQNFKQFIFIPRSTM